MNCIKLYLVGVVVVTLIGFGVGVVVFGLIVSNVINVALLVACVGWFGLLQLGSRGVVVLVL